MLKFMLRRSLLSSLNRKLVLYGNSTFAFAFATFQTPYEPRQKLCFSAKLNFLNPKSPLQLEKLDKSNIISYQFPSVLFKYDRDDVIGYAKGSVGLKETDKEWPFYTTTEKNAPDGSNFFVLPTFFNTIKIKLVIEIGKIPGLQNQYGQTVNCGFSLFLHRPIPPEGEVAIDIKCLSVMDKPSGTLYNYKFKASDTKGPLVTLDYQGYQVGVAGINGRQDESILKSRQAAIFETKPDHFVEFKTPECTNPESKDLLTVPELSVDQLSLSYYDPSYPRRYFSTLDGFKSTPVLHGPYLFAQTVREILHQVGTDMRKFKSGEVRFIQPVFPGQILTVSIWNDKKLEKNIYFPCKSERHW